MTTPTKPEAPAVSQTEQQVLNLYDKLRGLQLELSISRARQEHMPHVSFGSREVVLDELQLRVLEAKTSLGLRNDVVDNVVMVQPTLKAVHNATHTSPVERDLLPFIHQRELAGREAARQHSDIQTEAQRLMELEFESHRVRSQNTGLAAEVLQLAELARRHDGESASNAQSGSDITGLEHEVKVRRQRWKVMKGVASAIVAGSGIDWARDERLRDMVLDSVE